MASRPKGNTKQFVITGTGETVVTVGPGKVISILVLNPGASTFDVTGYTVTPSEAAERNIPRNKFILDTGVVALNYQNYIPGPVQQIGIDCTAFVGDITVDIMLASRAVSN